MQTDGEQAEADLWPLLCIAQSSIMNMKHVFITPVVIHSWVVWPNRVSALELSDGKLQGSNVRSQSISAENSQMEIRVWKRSPDTDASYQISFHRWDLMPLMGMVGLVFTRLRKGGKRVRWVWPNRRGCIAVRSHVASKGKSLLSC